MKIINRKKFIARITELFIFIGTIITTPMAINYANNIRGHVAYGGEYLLPILGLLIIMGIETFLETEEILHGQAR